MLTAKMTILTVNFNIKIKYGPRYQYLRVEVILPTNKRYPGITGDNP
jgi:hypothetical protein